MVEDYVRSEVVRLIYIYGVEYFEKVGELSSMMIFRLCNRYKKLLLFVISLMNRDKYFKKGFWWMTYVYMIMTGFRSYA